MGRILLQEIICSKSGGGKPAKPLNRCLFTWLFSCSNKQLFMRVAIYNNKGGVGKTTTAVNLGAGLARLGNRTLIVDMDPQMHIARHFGLESDDVEVGIEDALRQRKPVSLDNVIRPVTDNLWIAPCTDRLNAGRRELEGRFNTTTVLDGRLRKMSAKFDFIVMDTPPDRGVFSRNAMYAANIIFVPINLEKFAMAGIDPVMDEIIDLQASYEERNWTIRVATLRYDGRLRTSNQVCGTQVEDIFGESGYMLETHVRTDARLGGAQIAGQTIFGYDEATRPGKPPSKSAVDYLDMAAEFVQLRIDLAEQLKD